MSAITHTGSLQQELVAVVERFAAAVSRQCPGVRSSLQQGGNAEFPWWIVSRLSSATNGDKVLDVSVDCRADAAGWAISVDVSREDGAVLADLPTLILQPEIEQTGIQAVERFLGEHVEQACAELK